MRAAHLLSRGSAPPRFVGVYVGHLPISLPTSSPSGYYTVLYDQHAYILVRRAHICHLCAIHEYSIGILRMVPYLGVQPVFHMHYTRSL